MTVEEMRYPEASVPLPAALAYLILRGASGVELELQVRQALHRALSQNQTNPWGTELRQQAMSGMPRAIVPFRRNELDILCATHLDPNSSALAFCGEGMKVPAGYFLMSYGQPRYVDEVRSYLEPRWELMEASQVAALLEVFKGTAKSWPILRVPLPGEDEDVLMDLSSGFVPHLKPNYRSDTQAPLTVNAHMQLLKASGRVARDLGRLDLVWRWEGESVRLRYSDGLRPEWVMEMQAASMQRAWLHLDCGFFKYLGPMPDLLEPGSIALGWLYPQGAIRHHFGGSSRDVPVPSSCARALMQALPWALVSHPLYAYTAAFDEANLKEPV